jgi:NitT/TauT family transport system ATP-binding protein
MTASTTVADRSAPGVEAAGPAILASSVTKRFRPRSSTGRALVALDGVSLSVAQGEFVSVLGESGCGKSTLLKIAAGLTRPDAGRVELLGMPAREGRRDIGIMLQTPALLPWKNVLDNVALPFRVFGEANDRTTQLSQEMIDLVGLTDFERHYPWQLSGGMQQRVSLARLLVYRPPVKLMDEPFGALDEFTRERLNLELARIHEDGQHTILFVTHSIPEAVLLSDRIVVMHSRPGRVAGEVRVALPRPRRSSLIGTPAFGRLIQDVKGLLNPDVPPTIQDPSDPQDTFG